MPLIEKAGQGSQENVKGRRKNMWDATQLTRRIDPMLAQCLPTVYDAGPTLDRHWVYVSCFLGRRDPDRWKTQRSIWPANTRPRFHQSDLSQNFVNT